MNDPVRDAVGRIATWGEARDWRGYDPYDALNSPVAGALSLGTPLGRRLFTQAVKLSPLNLRPLLRIRPSWNAKAIALVASGYARLAGTGDAAAREHAQRWLEWLANSHSEWGWGYHFPVQTRFFAYPRGLPNTIATSFAAQSFLDAWELLGDERAARHALDVCDFLVDGMRTGGARPYFRYLAGEDELVHNANLLACAVLARAARLSGDSSLFDPARAAVETSLAAQRPDGSWPYADATGHDWVDNFHTAYVLDALAECVRAVPGVAEPLDRGVRFWEHELFLDDGTPKYFQDRLLPLDAHCYATAIDTWLSLAERRPDALERAERVALLLVERMLDPRGYVHFQRRRLWTSRVPFTRWTTAPTFRALAGVLAARGTGPDAADRMEADARLG
jgi:hypothetical protein